MLTGGGDCPGINAVLRSVTKTAIYEHGVRVFGFEDGFQGLIEDRVGELTSLHVSGILTPGGTILGSNNRCNPQRHYVGDDENGDPIGIDKAILRYVGYWVSASILLIGFLMIAFRKDKRGLHDLIAGTRVIRTGQ